MSDVPDKGVQSLCKWRLDKKYYPYLAVLLILVLMIVFVSYQHWRSRTTYIGPTSRVLVTSSKITGLDGYTQVFSDTQEDYAIYVRDDYSAAQLPTGTIVQVGAYSGTVSETHDAYFLVKDVRSAQPILPGTTVYYGKEAVGFVSTQAGDLLTCRYY